MLVTMPANRTEARVQDGKGGTRLVRPGDQVDLLPILPNEQEEDDQHITQVHSEFMHRYLEGRGPFTISWIGQWPCGRIMLYLKLAGGREPGTDARDFMAVEKP